MSPGADAIQRWLAASEIEVQYGAQLARLSLTYWDEDDEFAGPDQVFPDGYDQVVGALADGMDVRMGHVVTQVRYDGTGVPIETSRGSFQVEHAVVTVPLGVSQQGAISFIPALPEEKGQALERMATGLMNKVALLFPSLSGPKRRITSAPFPAQGWSSGIAPSTPASRCSWP